MISTKREKEKSQLIRGPSGQLELLVASKKDETRKAWGIVCHPHPLHGGTMQNKVVTTLVKVFTDLGANTVRFNFRGVGKSEGSFDNGVGELDDLLAVIEWVLEINPDKDVWLAGFSFGAYIAALAATRIPVTKLITVAPPVAHFDMKKLPQINCKWALAMGEKDDIAPAKDILEWVETRHPKPVLLRFPEATHFFHGQLAFLKAELEMVLKD